MRRTTGRKVSKKLRKRYATGTITKSKITQRGYNKFLKVTGNEHITVSCICFVALKVYRELGRLLKANNIGLSVDAVLNIAKTIPNVTVNLSGNVLKKVSKSGQVKN